MNILFRINQKAELTFEKREIQFFYPYLFRFISKSQIVFNKIGVVNLNTNQINDLTHYFDLAIRDLINDCYISPTSKAIQKHPTRYESIHFDGKKLKVDYTTSVIGRLIYLSVYKLQMISNFVNAKTDFSIEIEMVENEYFFPSES